MSAILMASLGYTFETKQHMTPTCHPCFLSFLGHIKILTVLSGGVSKTCITFPLMKKYLAILINYALSVLSPFNLQWFLQKLKRKKASFQFRTIFFHFFNLISGD